MTVIPLFRQESPDLDWNQLQGKAESSGLVVSDLDLAVVDS